MKATEPGNHLAALLLLADARLPSGAHAHSFGLEAGVTQGLVTDLADLTRWVEGCLHTVWLAEASAAGLAAQLASAVPAAVGAMEGPAGTAAWQRLDEEIMARVGSVHGRQVSRTLGRQLVRTGRAIWGHPALPLADAVHADGPTAPLALGVVTTASGADPAQAALLSLHHAVQSAGTAAIRLLGLDPYAVARLSASLGPTMTTLAQTALAGTTPATMPAAGAPMLDILLTHHQHADGRLFAS